MSRILLVEDHERLARLMREALTQAGIATDIVDRSASAGLAISQIDYRALVLDRGLPDGDGLQLLVRLRAAGNGLPCLMLTARDALHDRIEGLEAGADDYLPKPFAMDELVARVRALLRRPEQQASLEPTCGDLTLRPIEALLGCGAESVTLAPAELQILLLLMQRRGHVIRRGALEAAGWGLGEAVTPNALDVALHRIRRKLLAIGSRQKIVNARNQGYALRETD